MATAAVEPVPDDVSDHQGHATVGQRDGVVPVTTGRELVLRQQVAAGDLDPRQHR